jgi:hypothetical protein
MLVIISIILIRRVIFLFFNYMRQSPFKWRLYIWNKEIFITISGSDLFLNLNARLRCTWLFLIFLYFYWTVWFLCHNILNICNFIFKSIDHFPKIIYRFFFGFMILSIKSNVMLFPTFAGNIFELLKHLNDHDCHID